LTWTLWTKSSTPTPPSECHNINRSNPTPLERNASQNPFGSRDEERSLNGEPLARESSKWGRRKAAAGEGPGCVPGHTQQGACAPADPSAPRGSIEFGGRGLGVGATAVCVHALPRVCLSHAVFRRLPPALVVSGAPLRETASERASRFSSRPHETPLQLLGLRHRLFVFCALIGFGTLLQCVILRACNKNTVCLDVISRAEHQILCSGWAAGSRSDLPWHTLLT